MEGDGVPGRELPVTEEELITFMKHPLNHEVLS
jgi:hypothetical protein